MYMYTQALGLPPYVSELLGVDMKVLQLDHCGSISRGVWVDGVQRSSVVIEGRVFHTDQT